MDIEDAIDRVDQLLGSKGLSDLQEQIFRRVWAKEKYPEIAEALGYDANYIKDLGAKLWKQLSQTLDEKVTKSNIQVVLRRQNVAVPLSVAPAQELSLSDRSEDWAEKIDTSSFVGRRQSLEVVGEWLHDPGAVIAITGMAGIGKTIFAAKLAELHQNKFAGVIWRSLQYPKPLDDLIIDLLLALRAMSTRQNVSSEALTEKLLHHLAQHRYLIILDGLDSVMTPAQRPGDDLEKSYLAFLQCLSSTLHQSTVLVSCREIPNTWLLSSSTGSIRTRQLPPLSGQTVEKFLTRKGLFIGSTEEIHALTEQYGGNPLALQIVFSTILDLCQGSITEFLREGQIIFEGLSAFLQHQWSGLTASEQWVLYYLAMRREIVPFREIKADSLDLTLHRRLAEILATLTRRSLILKHSNGFSLQIAVMEYVTLQLTERIGNELIQAQLILIRQLPLLKVKTQDYIQATQKQGILQSILESLKREFTTPEQLQQHLKTLLEQSRTLAPDYSAGNLVNLMLQAGLPLAKMDLSSLPLWDVSFCDYALHAANLQNCDLSRTQFSHAFAGVTCVAISPDDTYFVSGHEDGRINLWDRQGLQLLNLEGHKSWIWDLAWTPDGQSIVSASEDQTLRVWNLELGNCVTQLNGHRDRIWQVICPANNIVISSSSDQTIKVWDLTQGVCTRTLIGHQEDITALALVTENQLLSGSADQTLRLWDFTRGELIDQWQSTEGGIWAIVYDSATETIYSAGDHGSILAWKRNESSPIQSLNYQTCRIWSIALSPCGRYLVAGGEDQQLVQWDLSKSQVNRVLPDYQGRIWSVSYDSSGIHVLTASDDNQIKLWDMQQGNPLLSLSSYSNWACDLTMLPSPDSLIIASAHERGQLYRWDLIQPAPLGNYSGHQQSVWAIASDPTGHYLVSGSDDHTVRIWNVEEGRCQAILRGHQRPVWSVDWSGDGSVIASGSGDRRIKLWDTQSGECLKTLAGHQSRIWSVSFSRDNQVLASGSGDHTVKIWDWHTGTCIHTLSGHDSQVLAIAFHPTRQRVLASVGGNGTCKIWTLASQDGETLSVKSKMLWSVDWSPNGELLAMGGDDGSIYIWHLIQQAWTAKISTQAGCIWAIAFTPDGTQLCSGSQDGKICLWDIDSGKKVDSRQPKRLYEGLNIMDATGLTTAQIQSLERLGARV